MSLPAPMTLAEVRDGVFTACTINMDGDRGARALKLVDRYINRAQEELSRKAWLRLRGSSDITLETDETEYDFPDDMDSGRIMDIMVRSATTLKWTRLHPDPSQPMRNAGILGGASRPLAYWFDEGAIHITPKPDILAWDRLQVRGFRPVYRLVNAEDLVGVDGEALIQRAEILVRPRMGKIVTPDMLQSHLAYVRDIASDQSEGGSVMMGGDTSAKCNPEDHEGGLGGNYAWDESWQPPGYPPLY